MTTVEVKELKKEVKRYIDHADERMVKAVYAMFESDQQEDWWGKISDEERAAIEVGLQQMKEGKTTPHEEVMKKYSKWLIKAEDSFENIIAYLEKEWTQREVINFVNRVSDKLELLRLFPKLGSPNGKKKTRTEL